MADKITNPYSERLVLIRSSSWNARENLLKLFFYRNKKFFDVFQMLLFMCIYSSKKKVSAGELIAVSIKQPVKTGRKSAYITTVCHLKILFLES